jgi:hypothetical protein
MSAAQKCLYGEFLSPEEQRTYGSLDAKVRHFCPILTKFRLHDRLSQKHPIASFKQIRPVGASLIYWDGETNTLKPTGACPDYVKAPKMALDLYMGRYGPIKLVQIFVCLHGFIAVYVATFYPTIQRRCTG